MFPGIFRCSLCLKSGKYFSFCQEEFTNQTFSVASTHFQCNNNFIHVQARVEKKKKATRDSMAKIRKEPLCNVLKKGKGKSDKKE